MQLLHKTTMDDMIAVFLMAELQSSRFGSHIRDQLNRDGCDLGIVQQPDLTKPADNSYRRQLLASYRAYVFEDLPIHTEWHRALVTRTEMLQIRYIDYSYWNELSQHTRLPLAAVPSIHAGQRIFDIPPDGFLAAAAALRAGAPFPELILVSTAPDGILTVFEGHVRLTAYVLAPECVPAELEVIVGFAPECATI